MQSSKTKWTIRVAVFTLLVCLLVPIAMAQTVRGSIAGVVRDSSDAVVARAQVTLKHRPTNRVRTTTTDPQGEFQFTLLPAGSYDLEIQHPGFRKDVWRIDLRVDQNFWLEGTLFVQGSKEEIPVRANELVRKDSAAQGTVIENRLVVGLPLDGRNFFDLSLLAPGTLPPAQGSATSVRGDFAVSINGQREDANVFLLDGVYNGDPKLNGVGVTPPVDAILEFEVLASNYDASFGRNAGGQVNVAVRSGSNEFHGTAYEFFRNAALDARNALAPSAGPDPKYQRHQFGVSAGGPLVRDRTFLFGDYEGRIVREGITRLATVPTAAERSGDFSALPPQFWPIDPFTGQPFPGGVIPSNRIDPIGGAIAALYPLPNRAAAGANFVSSPAQGNDDHRFDLRVDHHLTANSDLTARYSFADRTLFEPFAGSTFSPLPGYGNDVLRRGQNLMLGLTHIFSPAWAMELRFAWNRVSIGVSQENAGTSINQQVGLPELSSNPRDFGLSFLRITGLSPLGHEFNNPQASTSNTYQILDHVSWSRGPHLMKFGFEFRDVGQDAFRDVQSRGFLNFLGAVTFNPLADLLLGLPTITGGAILDNRQKLRTESWAFFFNDTWRLRRNLTLTAGLRYEYNSPPVDPDDRASIYDPTTQALVQVGTSGVPRSGYDADKNNFAPRLGLAWSPGQQTHTILRAGYGVYFDQSPLAPGEGLYFTPPFFNFRLFFSLPGMPLTLANPFPANFPVPIPPSALAYQRNLRTGYVQQWSLDVQRAFGNRRLLEVAYLGSKGTKLLAARDINQPAPSPVIPNLRPVPQFDDITQVESRASSSYHSLQARFQQQTTFGLTLLAAYTLGKSLDDASSFFSSAGDPNFPQDSNNPQLERARSNFDVRQRFTLAFAYDIPLGRRAGDVWMDPPSALDRFLDALFSRWQSYGNLILQSGRPFTVALLPEVDNSNTGRSILGFGANDRPDLVGNPNLSNPSALLWFNTAAFSTPPFGSFGDAGRNILEGPGFYSFNFSLLKDVVATERMNVQFRAEFFNLFNHPNYDLPDNFLGSPTFGQIVSAGSPRHIQFGFKLLW